MKKIIYKIYLIIVLLITPMLLYTQPATDGHGGGHGNAPINGFVFLLLLGIFYGAKNYIKNILKNKKHYGFYFLEIIVRHEKYE